MEYICVLISDDIIISYGVDDIGIKRSHRGNNKR